MARLTSRGESGAGQYRSSHREREIVQKLGAIEDQAEELVGMICEDCCRHPREAEADELDCICAGCAASRLMELIE